MYSCPSTPRRLPLPVPARPPGPYRRRPAIRTRRTARAALAPAPSAASTAPCDNRWAGALHLHRHGLVQAYRVIHHSVGLAFRSSGETFPLVACKAHNGRPRPGKRHAHARSRQLPILCLPLQVLHGSRTSSSHPLREAFAIAHFSLIGKRNQSSLGKACGLRQCARLLKRQANACSGGQWSGVCSWIRH